MRAAETQNCIHWLLHNIWEEQSHSEHNVRKHAQDCFADSTMYAPRLDIAVGPFNDCGERQRNTAAISEAAEHILIQDLVNKCMGQNGQFVPNINPRCLLAVEVAFSGSSKHMLGDITNASMMGYVGVIVGSEKSIGKIKRIQKYSQALRNVEKAPNGLFMNTVCLSAEAFIDMLQVYLGDPR